MRVGRWAACGPLLVALWVAWPYVTDRLVSGNDARDAITYHTVVADALAQAQAGVFPAYVGQSEWRYNGGTYPQAQAPWLSLLSVAIWVLSFGRLGSAGVLNGAIVLSLLGSAWAMQRLLARRHPDRPELPWVGSVLYVTCPGLLGILFRLDMVASILAAPFLPLAWGAALDLWGEGVPRRGAGLRLGLWTALIWMAHAPVALWTSTCLALFVGLGLVLRRVASRSVAEAAGTYLVASLWQFVTLFTLGGDKIGRAGVNASDMRRLAREIDAFLRADLPGALLPVGWAQGGHGPLGMTANGWPFPEHAAQLPVAWHGMTPYLQFGWVLWLTFLFGGVLVWRRGQARERALWGASAVPVLGVLPIPLVGIWIWEHLPPLFSITRLWPMQRLYLVAAAPVAILAAWTLSRFEARRVRLGLVLLLGLPISEAAKFRRLGVDAAARQFDLEAANAPLTVKDLQMSSRHFLPWFGDPALVHRWLSADLSPVPREDDSWARIAERCRAEGVARRAADAGPQVDRFALVPGQRFVLCTSASSAPHQLLATDSTTGFERRLVGAGRPLQSGDLELLPVYSARARELTVLLHGQAGESLAYGRAAYDLADQAVRVERPGPAYEAGLSMPSGARWLETPRQWVPGYYAEVDGRTAPMAASPRGQVMIQVEPGSERVRLYYRGTVWMQATLWVSLCGFVGCGLFLWWPRRPATR